MSVIDGETRGKAGRRPIPNEFIELEDYVQGTVISKGNRVNFKIDKDDFENVKTRQWCAVTSCNYIGSTININGVRKILYLHNFIMNKLTFEGKGQKESVDHINRDGLDNRKCNLRIVTQAIQNTNQKTRRRTAQLPEGITELPKHVWYVKAHGLHGDRFCIELKTEGVTWKTTSSKKVSIQDKLEQARNKLKELYEEYPYLN